MKFPKRIEPVHPLKTFVVLAAWRKMRPLFLTVCEEAAGSMIDKEPFSAQHYCMNPVEINLEDGIGKTVGRRKAPESARASAAL